MLATLGHKYYTVLIDMKEHIINVFSGKRNCTSIVLYSSILVVSPISQKKKNNNNDDDIHPTDFKEHI